MKQAVRRLAIYLTRASLLCLLCAAGLNLSLAQNNAPPAETAAPKHRINLVNEFTIKPGMMAEYLEWAKKEALPLYVKAGIREAYFFTNLYGGDRRVAVFVEVHDNFAAVKARNEAFSKNNSQEARAAWAAKARDYIENTHTYITETLPELGWRNPKRQDLPPYFIATRRLIAPFRGQEYENYLRNDYLPLIKKADAAGLTVSRVRLGGEAGDYRVLTPLYDLADLDNPNPVQKTVGQDAFRKLQQKALTGVVMRTENRVLQLRADISLIPGRSATAK